MVRLAMLEGMSSPPPPFDGERVNRGMEDLARAGDGEPGLAEALATLVDAPGGRELLAAVFGNSPFLGRALVRDAGAIPELFGPPPDAAFDRLMAEVEAVPFEGADPMAALRRARRRVALLIALADLAGHWDIDRVTGALSRFADGAVQAAIRVLLLQAAAKGDLDLTDPARPELGSGLAIIAMGKFGARELNYSSDIDFSIFFDAEAVPYRGKEDVQACFVRLAKGLVRLLQQATGDGYVFRTDLRLRPDPAATPAAVAMAAAEQYYESMGQNWERAAMIKARAAAGDIATGEAFLERLQPFVWRRNLDFAAIQDVHSIKRQIHDHKGHKRIAVEGHNIKLGRGGIRDIEFFVQTQQLIAGGRDPDLRDRTTAGAMAALALKGWITEEVGEEMMRAYRYHRMVEHRLQMIADEQTHLLPASAEGIDHVARFAGYGETGEFRRDLLAHLECVQRHYAALFEAAPALSEGGNLVFTGSDDDPDTLETLAALGYAQPAGVSTTLRGWHHGRYRAMRSARSRELLTDLMPVLLRALARTVNPDASLARFDRFLWGLPAGVQLFSMLHAYPRLLNLLAEVMGSAPRLANYIAMNAEVLDAVLAEDFHAPPPPADELRRGLDGGLGVARDIEDALDRVRRFVKERKFQIGVQILSGSSHGEAAGPHYADLADCAIAGLVPRVEAAFAERHGRVAGSAVAVVGMGKLGSREMSAESDLDLLFIYDYGDGGASDGERPLEPAHYFSRLAQRILAALTVRTAEGKLYEVDMRLRPSGNKGPVATRFDGFATYQADEAWTWEHMALTRARVIAGPARLSERIATTIDEVVRRPREAGPLARDVVEMRERLVKDRGTDDIWRMKQVRGGLVDIELTVQYLQLAHAARHPDVVVRHTGQAIEIASALRLLEGVQGDDLRRTWGLLHRLTGLLRIAVEGDGFDAAAPEDLCRKLAHVGGVADFATLEDDLRARQARAHEVFKQVVERAAG